VGFAGNNTNQKQKMADTLYAFTSFVCGIALTIVGLVNFFKHVLGHRWCDSSCFGPYLFWDDDDFFDDRNARFRQTFSLMPKPFGEHFGIFFLAFITLRAHFKHQPQLISSFKQNSMWILFVALFGAFPFAGGLGIVVGFFCSFTAALGMFCHLAKVQGSATLGLSIDNFRQGGKCGNTRLPGWVFKLWNVFLLAMLCLTVLNNVVHIFRNEFHHWCKKDLNEDCIGPFLIWPDEFARSVNVDKWGSVFSLDINRGLELWTPTVLVIWFLAFSNDSWFLASLFLIILALFGAFGFGGDAGIVLGIVLLVGSGFSMIIAIIGGNEAAQAPVGYSLMA